MATVWEEFGVAVAKARTAKKWTLEAVAELAFGNPDRKGYVSQIEKGRTKLHFSTVKKLAETLGLPDSITDPVFRADLPAEDEVGKTDRDAERLIRRAAGDEAAPPTAEALLITLAYEFANGSHIDLQTAYSGLRGALQAADSIKSRDALLQNIDDQLQAVMKEVARLNDLGQREEAAAALDEAMKRVDAERDAIFHLQLNQDRVLNRPDATAKRTFAKLEVEPLPDGIFNAMSKLARKIGAKAKLEGDLFDLEVSIRLATKNLELADASNMAIALSNLGGSQFDYGFVSHRIEYLKLAKTSFQEALRITDPKTDPQGWAMDQSNLGSVLSSLSSLDGSSVYLDDAVTAQKSALKVQSTFSSKYDWAGTLHNLGGVQYDLALFKRNASNAQNAINAFRLALSVRRRDLVPLDWAKTQCSLGRALLLLSELREWTVNLQRAEKAFNAALLVYSRDHEPFSWARTMLHLSDLNRISFTKTRDPSRLVAARTSADAAIEVFAKVDADHFVTQCNDLLTQIAAHEAQ